MTGLMVTARRLTLRLLTAELGRAAVALWVAVPFWLFLNLVMHASAWIPFPATAIVGALTVLALPDPEEALAKLEENR